MKSTSLLKYSGEETLKYYLNKLDLTIVSNNCRSQDKRSTIQQVNIAVQCTAVIFEGR